MGYRVEIHCDTLESERPRLEGADRCDHTSGASPMAKHPDPEIAVVEAEARAFERGYDWDGDRWMCLRCQQWRDR